MHIYIYIHVYLYIYIYIYTERDVCKLKVIIITSVSYVAL